MYAPQKALKLASSVSDQNVYFTYVCLVKDILTPNSFNDYQPGSHGYLDGDSEEIDQEESSILVERSKADHELVVTSKDDESKSSLINNKDPKAQTAISSDEAERSDTNNTNEIPGNPNILKLTKMKWLTEDQSPDSSSPSISPNMSSTSIYSKESEDKLNDSIGDKYLSTILRLDREHNMFGLSNIAIVGQQPSRKSRKEYEKPVFPQTAIVQVCCAQGCCRNTSKTDLPSSLKCGGCKSCCITPICFGSCQMPCTAGPCPHVPCCPSSGKCVVDNSRCYGMKIAVHRKPKYEPSPVELTPRSSCVMHKPSAARSCHHVPRCIPPSAGFPYLMPCFWPSRPSAPCSVPARCFHNPPCLAPRKRRQHSVQSETCPPKCEKCQNQNCLGNSPSTREALEKRFGGKK